MGLLYPLERLQSIKQVKHTYTTAHLKKHSPFGSTEESQQSQPTTECLPSSEGLCPSSIRQLWLPTLPREQHSSPLRRSSRSQDLLWGWLLWPTP